MPGWNDRLRRARRGRRRRASRRTIGRIRRAGIRSRRLGRHLRPRDTLSQQSLQPTSKSSFLTHVRAPPCKVQRRPGRPRAGGVVDHRFAVAGRFGNRHVARDDRLEDDLAKEIPHLVDPPRASAPASGRTSSARCRRTGVGCCFVLHHVADDLDHLRQPFHGEILALDRHEHFVRAGQRRSRQRPERRRAVDQHEVVGAEAGQSGARAAGRPGADRRGSGPRHRGSSAAGQQIEPRRCRSADRLAGAVRRRPADGWRSVVGPGRVVALHCGSRSTSRVCAPDLASAAARLTAVVVLPTPPF